MSGGVTGALVGFARALRDAGVAATPDRVQTALAALDALYSSTSPDDPAPDAGPDDPTWGGPGADAPEREGPARGESWTGRGDRDDLDWGVGSGEVVVGNRTPGGPPLLLGGPAPLPDRPVDAARTAVGPVEPGALYWAGRLSLCAEPDDLPIYDEVFAAYFRRSRPRPSALSLPVQPVHLPRVAAPLADDRHPEPTAGDDPVTLAVAASAVEVLRHRDIAALSAAERAEVRRLLALLAPATAPRRSRRRRPAASGEVDSRRTVRDLLRHGGEAVRLRRRSRRLRPRRLVLLLDVSGSMTPYADALLRFGHAAVRRRPTLVEVFTLGTRLTRVTRHLRHRDPDAALRAAGAAIPDWHGGTRLADSLRAFLDRWGQRGTAHGAVVVVFSDGWERGEPDALAAVLDRLSRLAYRLIWVNPHRGKDGYAPLAAGMAAALPYLDDFMAGHSLAALESLIEVIAKP